MSISGIKTSSSSSGWITANKSADDLKVSGDLVAKHIYPKAGTVEVTGAMIVGKKGNTAMDSTTGFQVDSMGGTKCFVAPSHAGEITTTVAGSIAYDSTAGKLKVYSGGAWVALH